MTLFSLLDSCLKIYNLYSQRKNFNLEQGAHVGDLTSLKHVVKRSGFGTTVTVLNTGAIITPEDEAMLQALHSRSVKGVAAHLEALAKRGSSSFMDQYYVGYGDKSIGDCGTTTIFIEGISMLGAKAIQDWSLYSGQESSTRYISFETQEFVNPYQTEKGNDILEKWRAFYLRGLPVVIDDLKVRHPKKDDEDATLYEKAIKARAFDIMRGFLPAGASTNLAWHTNLRQASDALLRLRHHPLFEVAEAAKTILEALKEAHQHSFNQKLYPGTEEYNKNWMHSEYYFDPTSKHPMFEGSTDRFSSEKLTDVKFYLENRPPKTELPKEIGDYGLIDFKFLLDFASFRDIQRHRAVYQRMPLITLRYGFEQWYLDQLPASLKFDSARLFIEQEIAIDGLEGITPANQSLNQYYLPMGYRIPCVVSGDLPSVVWLVELRATRYVHPTLRKRAFQMAEFLSKEFGSYGLKLHLDNDPDRFDVKRGEHDITIKE